MALVGTDRHDSTATFRGGWKVINNSGAPAMAQTYGLRAVSLVGMFRQNNDGPDWTRNRTTTTPDRYRPVPFKAIATGTSLIHRPARRDLLGRR